jgi:hypothetical protein
MLIMVIEQDEIDIGTGRQFPAAELSHPKYGNAAAADPAMFASKFVRDGLEGSIDDEIGQMREGFASPSTADRACQQPNTDEKAMLCREDAQAVKNILIDL